MNWKREFSCHFVLFACAALCSGLPSELYFDEQSPKSVIDIGQAVHLTDYIDQGRLEEAREAASVDLTELISGGKSAGDPPRLSYTGFINVNKTCDSHLFFWFVPAKNQAQTAPVAMWLQGGPGASSMFGLFVEHGPWVVDADMDLHYREYDWSSTHSMLYVDQPVGTGFSYTAMDECYARNQEDVARDLYSFLSQFFTIFPNFTTQEFYVTGESYAGKYVPAITKKIIDENKKGKMKINLVGMAIGNGICDPLHMRNYGKFLYEVGMIGNKEHQHFREAQKVMEYYIHKEEWKTATQVFMDLILDEYNSGDTYFTNVTGSRNHYNILQYHEPAEFDFYIEFLNQPHVRKLIHVGDKVFHNSSKVVTNLFEDIMKSVKPWVEEILNAGYKVLLFNGQLDIIVGYPLTESFVRGLEWQHSGDFEEAPRLQWKIGSVTAGYAQKYKNLAVAVVRNAGHMVPHDQPLLGFDLINRFTSGKPFSTNVHY